MKVGNIVDGMTVVDVKRINKMNLIQFTKAVSEYVEKGYKLDVHSSRQIGLVLQMDVYKLESNVAEGVGSTGEVVSAGEVLKEESVTKSPELTAEAHSDVMLPVQETPVEDVDEKLTELNQKEVLAPVKKTTRSKKTT